MDRKQAFSIILEAMNVANKQGNVFELRDAATIFQALQVIGEEFIETKPGEGVDKPRVKKAPAKKA